MDTLLIKIFATALTFSQVVSSPDTLKTHFDPVQDRQQVIELLRAGCSQVRKAFDVETVNLDDLISTAMEDPEAVAGGGMRQHFEVSRSKICTLLTGNSARTRRSRILRWTSAR